MEPEYSLAQLVLHDGMLTAINNGAVLERRPDIQPHAYQERKRTPSSVGRCMVCDQLEHHELHVTS